MYDEQELSYARIIQLRFGWLVITADASFADRGLHPNVLRITIRPSFLHIALVAIISRLPLWIQTLSKDHLPGLFLPERLILKKKKKGWDEEFDNEKAMYELLKALQGDIIPVCYGEVEFEGERALLLSYVDGVSLYDVTDLTVDEVRQMAEDAFLPLQQYGVIPDDMKLDNFILVGNKLVIIDLEHVYEPVTPGKVDYVAKSALRMLLKQYKLSKD